MKSLSRVLVATVCFLSFFPCTGEAADASETYRNVWVRTVSRNGTRISVGSRIHGGADASEGQFKYMVFLLSYGSGNHRYPEATCSASLIHPSWVLTAAHCVSPSMIAVAGRANLWRYWQDGRMLTPFEEEIDENKFRVQERKVQRVFVHPGYSWITNQRDLALVLLAKPFDVATDHGAPIAVLPLVTSEMQHEMKCTAVGWGLNDHEFQTFKLMFAADVSAKTTALGCHYLKDGPFICLKEGGAGICRGDSGSPLVCQGKAWGVASFSLSPVANSDCFSTNEEYYSEIYGELKWIRNTMENGAEIPAATLTGFTIAFTVGLMNVVITIFT